MSINQNKISFYTQWTRQYFYDLKLNVATQLLSEALKSNRYYNVYSRSNGNYDEEGIDPCLGPKNLDPLKLETNDMGKVSWETLLIKDKLDKINKLGEKFSIKTIQSQPSYYINLNEESGNFNTYFNIPFVELVGPIQWIKIFKLFQKDTRLSNCYFDINWNINSNTNSNTIRMCIIRPFIDIKGNLLYGFDDSEFFLNISKIFEEITLTNSYEDLYENINSNWLDPDLFVNNDWFILNSSNTNCIQISDNSKLENNLGFPLTTLNVRYCDNFFCFLKPLDIHYS